MPARRFHRRCVARGRFSHHRVSGWTRLARGTLSSSRYPGLDGSNWSSRAAAGRRPGPVGSSDGVRSEGNGAGASGAGAGAATEASVPRSVLARPELSTTPTASSPKSARVAGPWIRSPPWERPQSTRRYASITDANVRAASRQETVGFPSWSERALTAHTRRESVHAGDR